MKKLNVAIIGVGGYGKFHYTAMKKLVAENKVKLVAVVIRNIDKVIDIANELIASGCEIFPTEAAMYSKYSNKLDLVCIPTGIAFHKDMTINALKNGANVLLEKPAAGSSQEVYEMIDAEQKIATNLFVAVAFQHMYSPEIHHIKRYILSNKLGKLKKISAMGIFPRNDTYYTRNDWVGKRYDSQGNPIFDSPLNNAFAHYLNIALFVAGNKFETTVASTAISGHIYQARLDIETFDTCNIDIVTDNNVTIKAQFSHSFSQYLTPQLRFECENGTINWQSSDQNGSWEVYRKPDELLEKGEFKFYNYSFDTVVNKILNQTDDFVYTLENANQEVKTIELLHKTLESEKYPKSEVIYDSSLQQYSINRLDEIFKANF